MAVFTRTNGKVEGFGAVGRQLSLTKLAKTNMTQAELDAAVAFIQLTASVEAIGTDQADGTFATGVSDEVHVLSTVPAPAAGNNFGGVSGVTASVVAYFQMK